MNTQKHITHSFASPLGRDLFDIGVSAMLAHKHAQNAQKSLLEGLAKVGQPTYVDQCRAFTEDELDAMEKQDQEQRLLMNEATAQWERTHGRFDPA